MFISEDLEDLLNVSDRIGVMFHGRMMDVIDAENADIATIGMLMGGREPTDLQPGGTQ